MNLKLVAGDDFVGQVRNYLSGKTPFLRGTTAMLGLASEVIGANPATKPVVFLQLTWSQGDHMVGRGGVKLNELKGKKVVLQRGGPHVGLLDEILTTANAHLERHHARVGRRAHRRQGSRRPPSARIRASTAAW